VRPFISGSEGGSLRTYMICYPDSWEVQGPPEPLKTNIEIDVY
jgi:hypothetical protein